MFKKYMALVVLLFFASPIYAHWDGAYYRNASDGFNYRTQWMDDIRDGVRVSEMALPGTHNSPSYYRPLENVITQVLTIEQQLNYGVRVFDIRIRHTSDRFALHHGKAYLGLMFGDFLREVDRFLARNPTETVLFRLREDHSANTNNTRSMEETLKFYLAQYPSRFLKTNDLGITLGEARGKFILLANMTEFNKYGLRYGDDFDIQDDYNLSTNWDLYSKWEKVKGHMYKAVAGSPERFYVNYLSGSGKVVFPYFVASGHSSPGTSAPRLSTGLTTLVAPNKYPDFPRVSCLLSLCTIAFEGTNILFRDRIVNINNYLKGTQAKSGAVVDIIMATLFKAERSVGIVMSDFPGDSLIRHIVDNNYPLRKAARLYSAQLEAPAEESELVSFNDVEREAELKRNDPELYERLQKALAEEREQSLEIRPPAEVYEALLENRG